jgi:hypothetical protein
MTEQTSDLPPTTPPPTKPRRPRWLWWALGGAVAGAVFIILATVAVNGQSEPAAVTGSPPAVAKVDASTPEPQPTTEPAPADFVLSVTTLERTCFGSAGCNVTYRLVPGYVGPGLTDGQSFTVVYEVAGGEDGPQINSFTMRGTNIEYDSEESLQTTSPKAVLTAKVTEVLSN